MILEQVTQFKLWLYFAGERERGCSWGSTRWSRILSHPSASGKFRPPVMDVVVVVAVGQVDHLHADVAAGKLA